jgi:uncharacterized Ntn-hydrolase superfamily protein
MTFSIVARCPDTGQLGVAMASSAMAVAARSAFVRARVGAVVVQGACNPRLGPATLDMLAGGYRPEAVIRAFERGEDGFEHRQIALLDARGAAALHDGDLVPGASDDGRGDGCVAMIDHAPDPAIPARMVAAWRATRGELAERLIAALRVGVATGGETLRAAGLLVAERECWPLVDLRIDWSEAGDPVRELEGLWRLWRPQMRLHVARALNPAGEPMPRERRG